jgi:hypothetical protein
MINSHSPHEILWDFQVLDMGDMADTMDDAMEKIVSNGETRLKNDFIMNMFPGI